MPIDSTIIDRTLSTPQGESAYKVVEVLTDAGYDTWWVGGCVRDMMMGEVPDDIDIATEALPESVIGLFKKTDETSAKFGSVLVSLKGSVFEVTTFRQDDSASDGRHPESVKFGKRKEDSVRRDFTVNCMYWNPISGELFDPHNGEMDLNERLIRFIGDSEERIEHDALRLLRAIRFRAQIDGQYHPETFEALHKKAKNIEVLSGTRRFNELEKMLMGPHPNRAFEDLWETDVIEHLIPELHACKGIAQPGTMHEEGDVWDHTLDVISKFTEDHEADVRWAALLHDIGKPKTFSIEADRIHFNEHAPVGGDMSKEVLDRLQCTSKRRDKIAWLISHHMTMSTYGEIDDKRKAHWYFHPWFIELLQLFWLDAAGTQPTCFDLYESIIKDYNQFLDAHPRPKKPLLSGEEVMEILGIESGEKVGEYLEKLNKAQIGGKIKLKKEAIEYLKSIKGR
ncbi:MAG: CCA tRNA nucleotidyltransferase [Candidatus Peribacteraceae bacterium]|jgi:poly(A) polymerase|nr:CCA tRNA nucleotidyltransferase [Candidatus Peribacteraceae bacterium]